MMESFSQALHYPDYSYDNRDHATSNQAMYAPYNDMFDDDEDVKRPMNSFLLWAKIMRKKYASENPTLHNAEVSKLLGKIWNSMSLLDKRPYVERAERLRVIHMKNYPNYRYAPKKRKEKKKQRMISPEVAAALHKNFFDVKKIKNPKLNSDKNLIGNDLKSFGYLRNACDSIYETNYTLDKKTNYGRRNEKLSHNIKSPHQSNGNPFFYPPSFQSHTIQYKPEENNLESNSVETMTLHYYPRISEEIKSDMNEECTSFSLDEDFPDFLKKLIDKPLHMIGESTNQSESLWSDISEIIGTEF